MEIASAVLLLGGLYVISNQNKTEPFKDKQNKKIDRNDKINL